MGNQKGDEPLGTLRVEPPQHFAAGRSLWVLLLPELQY